MAPAGPSPEELGAAVDDFCRLYAAGRWFDAHEALERVWRRSPDPLMEGLQGLIQLAVAFEHQRRGNPRGARRLIARARPRLEVAPDTVLGLDLAPARAACPGLEGGWARREHEPGLPPLPAPPLPRRAAT